MKVLIADKLPPMGIIKLESQGCVVHYDPALSGDSLAETLSELDPEVLVVRSTRVEANHLKSAQRLSLVVRAGAGVNTIDRSTASARGVYVANCPGKNAAAVAELAWGHILNADRRISDAVGDLRGGQWKKKVYSKAEGIKGKTLGVLGCGGIGAEVIRRAHAFETPVVAWSRSLTDERAALLGVERAATPLEVAERCQVLTVHLALNDETRGIVNEEMLNALGENSIFINTSRGGLVDESALAKAVETKGLRAGLDVFLNEPSSDGPFQPGLVDLPGVYGTHHIGASTNQAQEAVASEAARIVLAYKATGQAENCVNMATQTPATHLLVVRHKDQVGVLANTLSLLREVGINVAKMQNIIFEPPTDGSTGAACARIQLVGAPEAGLLEKLSARDTIFEAKLVPLEHRS